jgi:hypothetical protein
MTDRSRPPLPRATTWLVPLAVAALASVAACSSSSGGHKAAASSPSSQTPSPTGSAGAPGSSAPASTVAAIKDAYAKVFASSTPEAVSLSLLQDGQAFKPTIDKQAQTSLAQKAAAKVSSVSLVSPNTAKVVFTIYISGSPVLRNEAGYAVRQNGVWKVSGKTFCALLTLQGDAPAVCKSAAATSLPH